MSTPDHTAAGSSIIPGDSRIIGQAGERYPRMSEAAAIQLTDGSTLVAWSRKERGDDFSRGEFVGSVISDGSLFFSEEVRLMMEPWSEVTDIGSVNFLRLDSEIRLIFLGRDQMPPGTAAELASTSLFQSVSRDDGRSWSAPTRIVSRRGYSVVNNSRVVRTSTGRVIIPLAFVSENIFKNYDQQTVFCLYSDDGGESWSSSNTLSHPEGPLMEPGVIECGNCSLYMTIRTKFGRLYEARSFDDGHTWVDLHPAALLSSEAPSTLFRLPGSDALWIFWCDYPYTGRWYERHSVAMAVSLDHGTTWRYAGRLEHDTERSFGYVSAHVAGQALLLTYYDWPLDRTKEVGGHFHMTSLRARRIPLGWLREQEMLAEGKIFCETFSNE